MNTKEKVANRLIDENSPYLLQHAYNPVDWYPWGEEAFSKAKSEDKPIFLSIGYSTCHWCHVMERESFESSEAADILNDHFIAIKVDKEERPDIDSVYMRVCQMLTGSGGWPLTILMDPDKRPFYAATYFPRHSRRGMIGLIELLDTVREKWLYERDNIARAAAEITRNAQGSDISSKIAGARPDSLPDRCAARFAASFDSMYGGFGGAPKFPSPHILLFLLEYHRLFHDPDSLRMVEKTLTQMYKGGIFDHIGYGFSRYSTDKQWLAPHFEKMLYDNALLIMAYANAFEASGDTFYKDVAYKTLDYVFRELTSPEGGFYCAQDADSDGVEGRYYVFAPYEVIDALGVETGRKFNERYDITDKGNFEGKNIPNLLKSGGTRAEEFGVEVLEALRKYREERAALHKDDKILTAWNSLMIAALIAAYKAFGDESLLAAAEKALAFIGRNLRAGARLYASYRNGRRGPEGFLDDYAYFIMALIELYGATYNEAYLKDAVLFCETAEREFYDQEGGGFHLNAAGGERLLFAPKETYDGAMPSGNSVMARNLITLSILTRDARWERLADEQVAYMSGIAERYPEGYSFFVTGMLRRLYPLKEIVCVLKNGDGFDQIKSMFPKDAMIRILNEPTEEYPLLNDRTTFYVCEGDRCLAPANEL